MAAAAGRIFFLGCALAVTDPKPVCLDAVFPSFLVLVTKGLYQK